MLSDSVGPDDIVYLGHFADDECVYGCVPLPAPHLAPALPLFTILRYRVGEHKVGCQLMFRRHQCPRGDDCTL